MFTEKPENQKQVRVGGDQMLENKRAHHEGEPCPEKKEKDPTLEKFMHPN